MSLQARGPADVVMALAVVHHLAISNNLPLSKIAEFLARIGRNVIIEFVPKSDSQVQRLLTSRRDVFGGYTRAAFEGAFRQFFEIEAAENISETERVLFQMRRRALPPT